MESLDDDKTGGGILANDKPAEFWDLGEWKKLCKFAILQQGFGGCGKEGKAHALFDYQVKGFDGFDLICLLIINKI